MKTASVRLGAALLWTGLVTLVAVLYGVVNDLCYNVNMDGRQSRRSWKAFTLRFSPAVRRWGEWGRQLPAALLQVQGCHQVACFLDSLSVTVSVLNHLHDFEVRQEEIQYPGVEVGPIALA